MPKSLVIVESPAKAKTINKFLGRNYVVRASMGHVRDLPKSKLGVDVEHGFEPDYVVIPKKKKVLSELKSEAKKADTIFLAPDPDREGEAISYPPGGRARQSRQQNSSSALQRDHQKGGRGSDQEPARDRQGQSRRAAGAPGARPAGGLSDLPASMGKGPPGSFRRPRAVGRAPHRLRERT